jgi:uncharacterized membrane protein
MKYLGHKSDRNTASVVLVCLVLMVGTASAVPTISWTGNNYPSDISADGSVVVGNTSDGLYETFRWTELTGPVPLGRHTGYSGGGAGRPEVSDDGQHVSATISTPDSLYATQGIWTKGIGWEMSMPPTSPSGGPSSNSYGSAWGISGDGSTVTGLYWRYGQTGGSAHANSWNRTTGVFSEHPSPIRNCRANGLNYDGSVAVGWSETDFGNRQPTVWENGTVEVLTDTEAWAELYGVSNDGNTVWGDTWDPITQLESATVRTRTDTGWQENILGTLPGTFIGYGQAFMLAMAEIGNIGIGYNEFTWGSGTGFVWTLNEGMADALDFFVSYGITFPEYFVIDNLTGISHDGKTFCGFGHDRSLEPTAPPEGFVITLDGVSAVPENLADAGLTFEPNYPNPFNPSTTIALSLDKAQMVEVSIYDAQGRLIRTLFDGALTAGRNEIRWDGRDNSGQATASGVYFSRARGEDGSARSQRMMLVK